MKSKIKTAVIGVGNMGHNHVRIYSEISSLCAVSDVSKEIGEPVAQQYQVPYYQDYHELLEKEQPEAISVVVPTKYHHQVTIDCLNAKVPTLVEKPIAATVAEAEEMIAKAKQKKTFLMVGHVERFNPAVQKLKKLVDDGKFGQLVNLLSIRVGLTPPKTANSDVALDLGIHDVDIFNFLLNETPKKSDVTRQKIFNHSQADAASISLTYSKVSGYIQTNWITPLKMRRLFVTGTNGFAELDYINQKISLYDKILITQQNGDYYDLISLSQEPKKEVYISRKEPLKQELKHFIKSIKQKQIDYSNAEYSMQALIIVSGD